MHVERHAVHGLDDAAARAEEAALEREVLGQIADGEEQPAHSLTSIAWRSPSLIRLKHIDVTKIITPGSAATTGFTQRA